jgi:hypothetical protein
MARSNGLWPLLPMIGLFLVYTSVHAIAKLDIHLLDNGELLISFVFSYFFYFLFFSLIYFSLLFLGFIFNDFGVFSFDKRIVSS